MYLPSFRILEHSHFSYTPDHTTSFHKAKVTPHGIIIRPVELDELAPEQAPKLINTKFLLPGNDFYHIRFKSPLNDDHYQLIENQPHPKDLTDPQLYALDPQLEPTQLIWKDINGFRFLESVDRSVRGVIDNRITSLVSALHYLDRTGGLDYSDEIAHLAELEGATPDNQEMFEYFLQEFSGLGVIIDHR